MYIVLTKGSHLANAPMPRCLSGTSRRGMFEGTHVQRTELKWEFKQKKIQATHYSSCFTSLCTIIN
uniref:Uncharacterized protein n=1 Tax=Romanomermis culicivorax TaxID=13658 RepID=A0A915JMU7_ROMCU